MAGARCRDLEQRDRRGLGRRRAGAALRAALDLRDGADRTAEVVTAHGACPVALRWIASGEPFPARMKAEGWGRMALTLYPVPGKEKSS